MGKFPSFILLTIVSSSLLTATAAGESARRKVEQSIGGIGQLRPPPPGPVHQPVAGSRNHGGRARFGTPEDRVAPWIIPNGEAHARQSQPIVQPLAPQRSSVKSFFDNEEPVPTRPPVGPHHHRPHMRNNPAPPPRGPFIPSIRLDPLVPEPQKVVATTAAPVPAAAEQHEFYDPYRVSPQKQRVQTEAPKPAYEEYDYYDPEEDFKKRNPSKAPPQQEEEEDITFFQAGRVPQEAQPEVSQQDDDVAQQRPFQDDGPIDEQPLFRPKSQLKKPDGDVSFFGVEGREDVDQPESRQFPEEVPFDENPEEEPRFDEQEEPRFGPEQSQFDGPEESHKFGSSEETSFDRPEEPKFGRPDEQFGRPEELKFGRPEGLKFRPEEPKFVNPEGSPFGRPEEPKFGRPEGPKFGRPDESKFGPEESQFGRPEGPKFGRPEGPKFGRPEEPKFGRPERPVFGNPDEEPNFDNFEYQKERPKFERPQNFGPPAGDFPPPEAERPNFNRQRPNKNRQPLDGPFGRPQEDERQHFNRNRPKNRPPTREPVEDGPQLGNPFHDRPEEPQHPNDERRPNRNRVRGNKPPQPVREPEPETFGSFGGFGAAEEPERPPRPGRRPTNSEPFAPFNDQHEPINDDERPPNFRKRPPQGAHRPNQRPQNLRDQEEGFRQPEEPQGVPDRPHRGKRPQNRPNFQDNEEPPRGRPQFFPKQPQQHPPNQIQQQQLNEDEEILGLTPFAKPKLPPGNRPANRRPPQQQQQHPQQPNKFNGRPVPGEEGRQEEGEFQRPEGPKGPNRQNHPLRGPEGPVPPPQRRPVLDFQGALNTVKTYMGIPVAPQANRVRPQGGRPDGPQRQRPDGARHPIKNGAQGNSGERDTFRNEGPESDDSGDFVPSTFDQFSSFQRSVDDKQAEEEGPEHRDLTEVEGPEHRGLPDSDEEPIEVQMLEKPTSAVPVVQQEFPTVAPELTASTTPESAPTSSTLFPPFNKRVRPSFFEPAALPPSSEPKLNPPRITSYKQRIEAMKEKAKQRETIRDKQDDESAITLVDTVKEATTTTEAAPKSTTPKAKYPPRMPIRKRIEFKAAEPEPEVMEMVPSEEKPQAIAPARPQLPANPYARRRNQFKSEKSESSASSEPELLTTTEKWQPTGKFTRRTSTLPTEELKKVEESLPVIPSIKKPNPFVNRFRIQPKDKSPTEEAPVAEETMEFGKKSTEEEPRVEFVGVVPPPPASNDADVASSRSDEDEIQPEEQPVETHLVRPETRSDVATAKHSDWSNSYFTMATHDPILPIEALLTISPRDNGKGL